MQCFRFPFLSRKSTEDDLATLAVAAESYCHEPSSDSFGPTILVFAEGTDLSPVHIEKSQAFAKKNDLPIWNKVLAPRALGLGHFLRSVGKDRLHQVLDLTIAYEDYILKERPTETSLIKGRAPQALHVAIRRFSADEQLLNNDSTVFPLPDCTFEKGPDLTTTNPRFEKFVRGLFALKEEILTNFYHQREEEKNFLASLESPCKSMKGTTTKYEKLLCDTKENQMTCIKSKDDELWLPTSELHLRTFQGFVDRIIIPWALAFACFYVNYAYLGWKIFLGFVVFFVAFVRFVLLRRPIHEYLFAEICKRK
jgi:hypothetical protein